MTPMSCDSTSSYYPLYPPVEDVNMDYDKFQSFAQMPLTPDVLIIPSELRYFVKVAISSFCEKQHFKKFISFDNMLTSVKNFSFYQSFHHKIWLKAKHFKMCFFFFDYLTRDVFEHLISICPQDVVGCVCVNPGRLTKGQVGGTYGRLLVQRRAAAEDGSRVSPCLAAQVVKI